MANAGHFCAISRVLHNRYQCSRSLSAKEPLIRALLWRMQVIFVLCQESYTRDINVAGLFPNHRALLWKMQVIFVLYQESYTRETNVLQGGEDA